MRVLYLVAAVAVGTAVGQPSAKITAKHSEQPLQPIRPDSSLSLDLRMDGVEDNFRADASGHRHRRSGVLSVQVEGRPISTTAISLWWSIWNGSTPVGAAVAAVYTVQCSEVAARSTVQRWIDLTGLARVGTYRCVVRATLQDDGSTTTTVASMAISVATMPTEALAPPPLNLSVTTTATTVEVRWDIDATAAALTGLAGFAVTRDGLVAEAVPVARGAVPRTAAATLQGLAPATAYSVVVAAQNAYGSNPAAPITATTLAMDCTAIVCGTPPSCGAGSVAVPVEYGNRSASCCPLYVCQPAGCHGGCPTGTQCTADACVAVCQPPCATCAPGTATCAVCGGGRYLAGARCAVGCPALGFAAVQPGANGTGGWCQPVAPCTFVATNGSRLSLPHNSVWCDGPSRSCRCELGVARCVTRQCLSSGGTVAPSPSPSTRPPPTAPPSTAAPVTTEPTAAPSSVPTAVPTGAPVGPTASSAAPAAAAVAGGWSAWTPWTACTSFGAVSRRGRTRGCTNPFPANGGADCVGPTSQDTLCISAFTVQPSAVPTEAAAPAGTVASPSQSPGPAATATTATGTTVPGTGASETPGSTTAAGGSAGSDGGQSAGPAIGVAVALVCVAVAVAALLYIRRQSGRSGRAPIAENKFMMPGVAAELDEAPRRPPVASTTRAHHPKAAKAPPDATEPAAASRVVGAAVIGAPTARAALNIDHEIAVVQC